MLREAREPLSIVEVAQRLDIHANTARFHLDVLEREGRIERVAPRQVGPGRPAFLFRASRAMDPAGPRNYELLASVLLTGIREDPAASRRVAAAGRAWGRRLAEAAPERSDPTNRLVALLDDLGFAPERRTTGSEDQIGLRHCPFLELAGPHADVVCPIHLGLMQGAMDSFGGPSSVHALEPFAEPDLCLARLGPRDREPTKREA